MTWVGWRLQRTETLIVLVIVTALAALLIPTGMRMADAYHTGGLGSCLRIDVTPTCGSRIESFQTRFQALTTLANWFTLIPGVIGALLAAPFVFDLEHRTYRLAWTQSITRGRWLLGKLGLPVLCALLAGVALTLLFTWWRAPQVHLNGRLETGTYDTEGTVVVGYTLFALGLAVAVGAVWRRAAAAVTVAFAGYFAARIFVDYWLRNHLVSPVTTTWKGTQAPTFLYHALVVSETAVLGSNRHVDGGGGFLGGHSEIAAPGLNANTTFRAVYQPASHFWELQLTETAVFAGAAVVLILFAAWWTRRRAA
jgi:hypothetical protein